MPDSRKLISVPLGPRAGAAPVLNIARFYLTAGQVREEILMLHGEQLQIIKNATAHAQGLLDGMRTPQEGPLRRKVRAPEEEVCYEQGLGIARRLMQQIEEASRT